MFKHTQLLISLIVALFFLPTFMLGQELEATQVVCDDPNDFCMEFRINDFPPVEESPFEDPPFYFVFIEYGDGFFDTLRTPDPREPDFGNYSATFRHNYSTLYELVAITRTAKINITPVKIIGPKPPEIKLNVTIDPGSSGPNPLPDYVPEGLVGINASWSEGIENEDTLSTVIIRDSTAPVLGKLTLHYNSKSFEPINPSSVLGSIDKFGRNDQLEPGIEPEGQVQSSSIPDQTYFDSMIEWDYESVDPYMIFMDFKKNFFDPRERVTYILATISPVPNSGKPSDVVDMLTLPVNGSRDPNDMTVDPDTIFLDDGIIELTYTINFHNEGAGPAKKIIVKTKLPDELDFTTFQHESAYIQRDSIVLPNISTDADKVELNLNTSQIIDGIKDTAIWTFSKAELLGLDQGLIDPRFSEGQIVFKIKTKANLASCTSFKTHATISFDFQPDFDTNEAQVSCIEKEKNISNLYWCIIFLIILIIFLIIVWLISRRSTSNI